MASSTAMALVRVDRPSLVHKESLANILATGAHRRMVRPPIRWSGPLSRGKAVARANRAAEGVPGGIWAIVRPSAGRSEAAKGRGGSDSVATEPALIPKPRSIIHSGR